MTAAPTIRVRHLWHKYGAATVLEDVSFDVGPGEIFGFIGPNGAGKTTTIRVMATLLEPMAGKVEIDGVDVALEPDLVRRTIGYMPDHPGVYDRISVREYLEFFADAYRVTTPGIVDTVLELTDLVSLEGKVVSTLSKGNKQRLQLARILLHDPKVLILDEPASDLDPRARIEIRDLLLELRQLGKTIFLSSHILTELSDVCTSVGILERGKLVVAGPISEIGARLAQLRAQPQPGGMPPQMGPPAYAPPYAPPHAPPLGPMPAQPMPVAERPGRLKMRVLGPPERAVQLLMGGPGILEVELHGGLVMVTYLGGDAKVAECVLQLVRNGVGVVGVEPERNELERIFLEVTGGKRK